MARDRLGFAAILLIASCGALRMQYADLLIELGEKGLGPSGPSLSLALPVPVALRLGKVASSWPVRVIIALKHVLTQSYLKHKLSLKQR